uniref:Uncharacterized protein n=1 Tax=Cannabis sativa TaxID=3483 RepID=A0A803P9I2_CANSA
MLWDGSSPCWLTKGAQLRGWLTKAWPIEGVVEPEIPGQPIKPLAAGVWLLSPQYLRGRPNRNFACFPQMKDAHQMPAGQPCTCQVQVVVASAQYSASAELLEIVGRFFILQEIRKRESTGVLGQESLPSNEGDDGELEYEKWGVDKN